MALTKISNDGVKKPIALADNEKVRLGTGDDFQLYHGGSNSFINNTTGEIRSNATWRWDDSAKVTLGYGNDLQIYHDGTDNIIATNNSIVLQIRCNGTEKGIEVNPNGNVELYYDGSKKLETTSTGVHITGGVNLTDHLTLDDTGQIKLGDSADLQIYHNGTNNYLDSINGHIYLRVSSTENAIKCTQNGNVEISYDGTKKFETTNTGVTVTGTVSDSKGDLRKIPQNYLSTAYTLVAADSGKHVSNSAGITVPASVFDTGDAVTLINRSGSAITITQGTGVSMYNAVDGSTGNRTLAGRGIATVLFTASATCYISGAGLT